MTRSGSAVPTAPPTRAEAPAPETEPGGPPSAPARPRARAALVGAGSIAAALAGIAVVWYAVSYLVLPPDQRFLLPPPHTAFGTALSNPNVMGPMLDALGRSAAVALIGLVVAVVLGVGQAVVMSQSRWAERILYPYAVILQTIPILALVPLIGIWMGYGFPARITVCVDRKSVV